MLIAAGLVLLIVVVALIIWGRVHQVAVFVILPSLFALVITGFDLRQVGQIIKSGIMSMGDIACMFTFSLLFFNIMVEVGVFDFLINILFDPSKNNVMRICMITAFVSMIAQMDGVGATSVAIALGIMLPVFKSMNMRMEVLISIVFLSSAVLGFLPWDMTIISASAITGIDPTLIWKETLPAQAASFLSSIVCIFAIAKIESKRLMRNHEQFDQSIRDEGKVPVKARSQKLLITNIILLVVTIVILMLSILPTNYVFMLGTSIALLINFKTIEEQKRFIGKHSLQIITMIMTIFSIGIFTSVLNNTGMLVAIANGFVSIFPKSLGGGFLIIVSVISVPLMLLLGSSPMLFVILPFVVSVAEQYGFSAIASITAILVGCNYGAGLSPAVAPLMFALNTTDLEYGKYIKFASFWLFTASIIMVALLKVIGYL